MKGEITKMLENYKKMDRISFSMPGHKNGKGIDDGWGDFDVTELHDTDSLHNSSGVCKRAEENIAKIYGADMSLIMVNGSTGGIFTMLASVLKRGDTFLVSRLVHMSVINASVALGLKPIFFEHKFYPEFSIYGEADLEDFSEKLTAHPVKAVMVVSPNYNGVVSDIKAMSEILASKKIPLLVDEAHGAHFIASDDFPENAIRLGADMAVTSTHKTLNALNQSAILNIKSDLIDYSKAREVSTFFQTSSPLYPIAASCENSVLEIKEDNSKWIGTVKNCRELIKNIEECTKIKIPQISDGFFGIDPTRITLNFSCYNIEGHKISEILRANYNIDVEMADRDNVLLIITPSNCEKDIKHLADVLIEIRKNLKIRDIKKESISLPKINKIYDMSDTFYAEGEYVSLEESIGRISKKTVTVYPPGIPVIMTGEEIGADAVAFLKNSDGEITGISDGFIEVKKEGF